MTAEADMHSAELFSFDSCSAFLQGPSLLTWIYPNPSMDK